MCGAFPMVPEEGHALRKTLEDEDALGREGNRLTRRDVIYSMSSRA